MDPNGTAPQDWALLWGNDSLDWRSESYIDDEVLIFGESRPPRSEIDVLIDLALAYARKGQATQHLPELLADLAEIRGGAEKPWVLGSLWRFREELDHGNDPAAAAREAIEIVHRREMSLKGLSARRHPTRKKSPSGRTKP